MSRLTEALDRIGNYLQQHAPEVFATLQPGLSYEEIEEIVKDLPFRLPPEVYELYQWRNGTDYYSSYSDRVFKADYDYGLFPLQNAVKTVVVGRYSSYRKVNLFFRIVEKGGYILIDEELSTCRVILGRDSNYPYSGYQYTSLTNMMLTIAECYETGVYNKEPLMDLNQPDLETTKIWWKYNHDIKDIIANKMQTDLFACLGNEYEQDIFMFEDSRAVDILIQALQPPTSEITDIEKDRGTIILGKAAIILGGISDVKAVEALISALQDARKDVRRYAAKSLGIIGYYKAINPLIIRAVEALIIALQDECEYVRMEVAYSLGRLKDERAIKPLIHALEKNTSEGKLPSEISHALVKLRAVEPLIEILHHQNPNVRLLAAWALGQIGDKRAIAPLLQLLGDADSTVRETVREALEAIDTTSRAIAQREETPKSGIFQKFPISPITPIAPISPIGPISGITPISPIGPISPISP